MHKLSVSLFALVLSTAAASAQCFENSIGVPMPRGTNAPGVGDDYLFDLQPLTDGVGGGIAGFPIGATSYTHAHVQTNGVMFLTTGTASGATTTGYSSSAATMVTNLRGTAGQPPRLAAYWRDLNILASNSGAVYFNNTLPGRFVVTWLNAVHYSSTSPVFTVQAQLYADGHVTYYYAGVVSNVATPIVGVSEGNAIADPGIADLSTAPTAVSTSRIVYETFAANTFDLNDSMVSFVPNAGGGYDVGVAGCPPLNIVVATKTTYGIGCTNQRASMYEGFTAGPSDLGTATGTNSIQFLPNGQGDYLAINGSGTFFPPVAADLALGDDGVSSQTLPFAFPIPGGSTMGIAICSNGYLWLDGTQTVGDYTPTSAELLSSAPRLCPQWGDLNPTYIDPVTTLRYGSIHFDVDPVSGDAVVTWLHVPMYDATTANPRLLNTFQVVLRQNGSFEYRWQDCASTNTLLVGFSEGLGANDPGAVDLSSAFTGSLDTGARVLPLSLDASARPLIGSGSINLLVDNLPAGAALGVVALSFVQQNPGIDLTPIGMPGCSLYANFDFPLFFAPAGTSHSVPLAMPSSAALAGLPFAAQAGALAAAVNALGAVSSNGLSLVLGNL